MILFALILGVFTTIIGALPPGASNLAVVQTTLKNDYKASLKITYGAGIGEVLLALLAYSAGMLVQDFFEMNTWIQYVVAFGLFIAGLYVFKKQDTPTKEIKRNNQNYFLGFTLGILNPPVLIYWVVIFSLLHKWMLLHEMQSMAWILLFLIGVFIGKISTLFGYRKFGLHLQKRSSAKERNVNKVIGSVLLGLSILQVARLAFL